MSKYLIKPRLPVLNLAHPLARRLIFNAPLFENGGLVARDIVKKKHGTITNATWVKDAFGPMLEFNGTSAYVQFPLWYPNIDKYSVSVWFKTANYAQSNQPIYINGNNVPTTGRGVGLYISGNNTTAGTIYLLDAFFSWNTLSFTVTDALLHNIFMTVDGSGGFNTKVYLDGVLKFTGTPFTHTPLLNSYIGGDAAGYFFNGRLNVPMFWDRVVSPLEVKQYVANPWAIYKKPKLQLGKSPSFIKSVSSVTRASIKNINGLALGSVKSVSGVRN